MDQVEQEKEKATTCKERIFKLKPVMEMERLKLKLFSTNFESQRWLKS